MCKNNRSRYQLLIPYLNPLCKVGNKEPSKRDATKNNNSKNLSGVNKREEVVKTFINIKTLAQTC